VPDYLTRVRGGRPFPPEFVEDFKSRFRLIGGSPLLKITHAQAKGLQEILNATATPGERYQVVVGMRHAPPMIDEAMAHLAAVDGVQKVIAIIMAPQQTPGVMSGYYAAAQAAQPVLGSEGVLRIAPAWHTVPAFLDGLARRLREALDRLSPGECAAIPVVMSAHSLPKHVVSKEPAYTQMLHDTAAAVAARVGLSSNRWRFSYQSAGQSDEEWLKPDLKEVLPQIAKEGHKAVLIAPVQFLADHLEILYDIDIAAKRDAEAVGLKLHRIEGLNTAPELIAALAEVVRRERSALP
jgi:ferrochelatase